MRRGAIHTGGNTRLNVIDFVVEGTDFANVTTHFKRGGFISGKKATSLA